MDERPFECDFDPDHCTLRVSGVIDEAASPRLREALRSATEDYSRDATVDLTDVDFLPSTAVGVLAVAQNTAQDGGVSLDLVAASGTLAQRVLTVCAIPHRES